MKTTFCSFFLRFSLKWSKNEQSLKDFFFLIYQLHAPKIWPFKFGICLGINSQNATKNLNMRKYSDKECSKNRSQRIAREDARDRGTASSRDGGIRLATTNTAKYRTADIIPRSLSWPIFEVKAIEAWKYQERVLRLLCIYRWGF